MTGFKKRDVRNLVLVLGDQLDEAAAAFNGFSMGQDVVWMAEVPREAEHVPSHKVRIAFFLAAMRHFRDRLRSRGYCVDYHEMTSTGGHASLPEALRDAVHRLKPLGLVVTECGAWRVEQDLREVAKTEQLPLDVREDRHFMCSRNAFKRYAAGRKQLRMEFFYRAMRREHDVLMEGGQPTGGRWNFDAQNRESFGKQGPGVLPAPPAFPPDRLTGDVLALVADRFAKHPGSLDDFDWPVGREDALLALDDFIRHRLPRYGDYQDAMWTGEPFLYHALLSAALNVKLLNPREVIEAAERAYRRDPERYRLSSVEGFIRQILGWREYVRGIYWLHMPDYLDLNALDAQAELPGFYWTGKTDMKCLSEAIGQTLEYGYAHHIQRLMVTGLFALLLGVHPRRVHEWYLAVYVDAVEWVELPNTLGMSQYGDGGIMASKPYTATGKYIHRMSNYCASCKFNPANPTGEDACPFTTLYWDFLMRHEKKLSGNQRMTMQLRNLKRLDTGKKKAIRTQAERVREQMVEARSPGA